MTSPRVLFAILLAGVAGCSAHDRPLITPTCGAEPFPPPHAQIPPCSAVDVLHGAVRTLYRLDPAGGLDPRVVFEAARPLMSGQFAVTAGPGVSMWSPITVTEWQTWVDDHLTVTSDVKVTADDHPADTATSTARVLAVHLTPKGGRRWSSRSMPA